MTANAAISGLAKGMDELLEELDTTLPDAGTPISLSEAERRYGVKQETLSRWARKGYIATLQAPVAGGAPRLVDERDVAKAAHKYKASGGSMGKHTMKQMMSSN